MEWFKGKAGQLIALVGIVSTLAGFGYTGAGYVNRIENLEAKIGGIAAGRENLQNIEERFAAIEASVELLSTSKTQVQGMEEAIAMLQTSVSAINNTIDKNLILEVREASNDVTTIAVDVSGLQSLFESLEKSIEDIKDDIDDLEDEIEEVAEDADSNPLAN
jgi:DNA repair exonuclease SbcCD ATPase subunit